MRPRKSSIHPGFDGTLKEAIRCGPGRAHDRRQVLLSERNRDPVGAGVVDVDEVDEATEQAGLDVDVEGVEHGAGEPTDLFGQRVHEHGLDARVATTELVEAVAVQHESLGWLDATIVAVRRSSDEISAPRRSCRRGSAP